MDGFSRGHSISHSLRFSVRRRQSFRGDSETKISGCQTWWLPERGCLGANSMFQQRVTPVSSSSGSQPPCKSHQARRFSLWGGLGQFGTLRVWNRGHIHSSKLWDIAETARTFLGKRQHKATFKDQQWGLVLFQRYHCSICSVFFQ